MTYGYSNIQIANFGIPETFVGHGSHSALIDELGLTPQKISEQIVKQFGLEKMEKTVPVCNPAIEAVR